MGSKKKFNRLMQCVAVILSLAFAQLACSSDEKPSEDAAKSDLSTGKGNTQLPGQVNGHQVIVYYFHGKFRCPTCKKIEKLTREAVSESFAQEMGSGAMQMKVINVEEPENSHFTKDYQLFTKSVVVSDIVDGKEKQWKNLQKVWELVHDEKAFKEYIRSEVNAYL